MVTECARICKSSFVRASSASILQVRSHLAHCQCPTCDFWQHPEGLKLVVCYCTDWIGERGELRIVCVHEYFTKITVSFSIESHSLIYLDKSTRIGALKLKLFQRHYALGWCNGSVITSVLKAGPDSRLITACKQHGMGSALL